MIRAKSICFTGKGALMPDDGFRERRKYPRVKFAISVELRYPGTAAPLRAMTSEVSAGGLYIENMFTLDVGTPVAIVIWLGDEKINVKGKVATRYPQVGNGIDIVEIASPDRQKLDAFLEKNRHPATPFGR